MSSESIDIKHMLDDLVHQFADPLAFFRELVQNSIDAGTGEIEIELSYDQERQTAQISLADWGEGMNRSIIETKLTRLFSSGKDDDLTKIGRFGIGFVSVFAIAPEMVVVDTGRDGEYWRVIFNADRSFELYALEAPVEGTLVRMFKAMDGEEFRRLEQDARRVIVTWCKHASVPIYFDGHDVRQPFEVGSSCVLTHEEEGTRIVMGYVDTHDAPVGYYNRGLTLMESPRGPWPYVSFKIDSRYLEHTLTRDQIIEDEHFAKAYGILRRMATSALPEKVLDRLETLAHDGSRRGEYGRHAQYMANYLRADHHLRRPARRRRLFQTVDGGVTSLIAVERAARRGRVYLVDGPGPLAARMGKETTLIVNTDNDGIARFAEAALGRSLPRLEEHFWLMPSGTAELAHQAMSETMVDLLAAIGFVVGGIVFSDLRGCGPTVASEAGFLVEKGKDFVVLGKDTSTPKMVEFQASKVLVVDATHETIVDLVAFHGREPEWAAMTLLKVVCVCEGLTMRALDGLVTAAVELRQKRRSGALG